MRRKRRQRQCSMSSRWMLDRGVCALGRSEVRCDSEEARGNCDAAANAQGVGGEGAAGLANSWPCVGQGMAVQRDRGKGKQDWSSRAAGMWWIGRVFLCAECGLVRQWVGGLGGHACV